MAHLRRVVVVGTTGSGKSTLAENLAEILGSKFIELDALHWEPNWTEAPNDVFRDRVVEATKAGEWVIAGNYGVARDVIWPKATSIIWLNYSFGTVFWRLFWRTMKRGITHEELWNGNRESLHTHFFTSDSLFLWMLRSYWRRKRTLPLAFNVWQHRHLKIIPFHTPAEAERWMKSVEALAKRAPA